jgi:hypothetical protein
MLILGGWWIGFCVGVQKNVMANEIAKIDDLHFFFLDILSELIVECVIGFGRFVRILK